MAAKYESLTIDEVKKGDTLPPLSVDVSATTIVLGALASRDWRPMHHDKDFAINRNGTRDIFMNTPNQAAWFERYLSDWTGPTGRLGRIKFRMHDSVFPGDTITFQGTVENVETDDLGCSWAEVALALKVEERTMTTFTARIALPSRAGDNPWKRRGDDWKP
jgi:acyl dehydratase